MKALWEETKRVPVVTHLLSVLASLRDKIAEEGGEPSPAQAKEVQRLEALIAKRKADPDMHVTVKHVGTPDDPGAWDRLVAGIQSERHAVETRVRMALLAAHGAPQKVAEAHGAASFQDAVLHAFVTDPEWQGLLAKQATAMCEAGLVGGAAEAKRLVAQVGPGILQHLAVEVRAYQDLDIESGEG